MKKYLLICLALIGARSAQAQYTQYLVAPSTHEIASIFEKEDQVFMETTDGLIWRFDGGESSDIACEKWQEGDQLTLYQAYSFFQKFWMANPRANMYAYVGRPEVSNGHDLIVDHIDRSDLKIYLVDEYGTESIYTLPQPTGTRDGKLDRFSVVENWKEGDHVTVGSAYSLTLGGIDKHFVYNIDRKSSFQGKFEFTQELELDQSATIAQ